MPLRFNFNPHTKQQIARFARVAGTFAVSSGALDAALGSTWLSHLIGAGTAATIEVAWRQFSKVTPKKSLLTDAITAAFAAPLTTPAPAAAPVVAPVVSETPAP